MGEDENRKPTQEKRLRKAVRTQEGKISSRESYCRTALGNVTAVTAWIRIEIGYLKGRKIVTANEGPPTVSKGAKKRFTCSKSCHPLFFSVPGLPSPDEGDWR
jgi:hypothetical protein